MFIMENQQLQVTQTQPARPTPTEPVKSIPPCLKALDSLGPILAPAGVATAEPIYPAELNAQELAKLSRSDISLYLKDMLSKTTSGSTFALQALSKLIIVAEIMGNPTVMNFAREVSNCISSSRKKDKEAILKEKEGKGVPGPAKEIQLSQPAVTGVPGVPANLPAPVVACVTPVVLPKVAAEPESPELKLETAQSIDELEKILRGQATRKEGSVPIMLNPKKPEALPVPVPDTNTKGAKGGKFAKSKKPVPVRYKPVPVKPDFLRIADLRKGYDVVYHNDYDTLFTNAIKSIFECPVIGIDAEYRMGTLGDSFANIPSYFQVSTSVMGHVFNIERLACEIKCLRALAEICASSKLKKVGHSTDQDVERVLKYLSKRYGITPKVKLNTCNIEQDLYTIKPPSIVGLSDISHRYLGKHMRKKEKCVRTGAKAELTKEVQIEYVALDALLPLEIYQKFRWVLEATIPTDAILGNSLYAKKFFVDKGLQVLMKPLTDMKIDSVFLSGVSHQEIIELCRRYPDRVLITHDKFLLLCKDIPNKIPYYSNEQVFAQLKKLSIELFSTDEEDNATNN